MKALLAGVPEPKAFVMTVNAGHIPLNHWTQDLTVGGGRIVGEACHFIDLLRHLAGVPIVKHSALALRRDPSLSVKSDNVTVTLEFADGSIGTIHYFANGDKSFPKERLEVFCAGRVLQLDNFRRLRGFGWSGFKKMNLWRQNKGNQECAAAFVQAIRQGKPAPIPAQELIETAQITFAVVEELTNGAPVINYWERVMKPMELIGCEGKGSSKDRGERSSEAKRPGT
jgi:predicted dehydrogenase